MRVLVAGAGLAGLTFASALERLGADVEVELVDERPALGGGAAITLAPNALAALDHVGLGDVVRDLGAPADAGTVRRPGGSTIRSLDATRTARLLGEPVRVVDRGELQSALRADLDRATVWLGSPLVRVHRPLPGRVVADLADGDRLEADALVGADGFRSAVARALDPQVTATYAGCTAWRGVAATPVDPALHGVVWGDRCEAGVAPMTGGRTYWFATVVAPFDRSEDPDLFGPVRERLLSWGDPWPALLAASVDPGAPIGLQDRTGPRRWASGDVVVIGDAAHPMQPALGQGGAQAIVDAVLLAGLLARRPERPAEVFATFERERRRRVRPVVAASARALHAIHGERPVDRVARRAAELVPQAVLEQVLRRIASRAAWESVRARSLAD